MGTCEENWDICCCTVPYSFYRLASAVFGHSGMAETRIRFEEYPEEMLAKLIPLMERCNLTKLLKSNMKGRKKASGRVPRKP